MAKSIEDLFRFKVKSFKPVLDDKVEAIKITQVVPRSGREMEVLAYKENGRLCLIWRNPERAKCKVLIDLESRESNLHKGKEYFFVVNGYRGRVLYSNGYYFCNRIATGLNYTQQNESRTWRAIRVYRHRENLLSAPYRKYHYRGYLTPYGKRYNKAQGQEQKYIDLCNNFLFAMSRKRKK